MAMVKILSHNKQLLIKKLAYIAVESLIEEVELSPKPGLVDKIDSGPHNDLTLTMMKASAYSLKETFFSIADVSYNRSPSQGLREEIAEIGRSGENYMFEVTGGINTHKGAIWALGLLVSAVSSGKGELSVAGTLKRAGCIASYLDSKYKDNLLTNGKRIKKKFAVLGAKEEAEQGFPHILHYSYPSLINARRKGMSELESRIYSLFSLIENIDDTCILHRGGIEALLIAKEEAGKFLNNPNFSHLNNLNQKFTNCNISPGGSADLLAATLFLDKFEQIK